jgi:hypothetical protein
MFNWVGNQVKRLASTVTGFSSSLASSSSSPSTPASIFRLFDLPEAVVISTVFAFLDPADLLTLQRLCQRLSVLIRSEQALWQRFIPSDVYFESSQTS